MSEENDYLQRYRNQTDTRLVTSSTNSYLAVEFFLPVEYRDTIKYIIKLLRNNILKLACCTGPNQQSYHLRWKRVIKIVFRNRNLKITRISLKEPYHNLLKDNKGSKNDFK